MVQELGKLVGILLNPQPITKPWLFLTVAVIGLVGNVVSILLLHSEKGKSLNMKTAFLHMAYDALSSAVVLIGGIVILFTDIFLLDAILSAVIALMIFWSSYLVIKEAVLIFMESTPAGIDFDEVFTAIRSTPGVEDVHDLHIWSLSSRDTALSRILRTERALSRLPRKFRNSASCPLRSRSDRDLSR